MWIQKLGTAIGTKFTPPYTKQSMARIEGMIFSNAKVNTLFWFDIWADGLDKLKDLFYLFEFKGSDHYICSELIHYHQ